MINKRRFRWFMLSLAICLFAALLLGYGIASGHWQGLLNLQAFSDSLGFWRIWCYAMLVLAWPKLLLLLGLPHDAKKPQKRFYLLIVIALYEGLIVLNPLGAVMRQLTGEG